LLHRQNLLKKISVIPYAINEKNFLIRGNIRKNKTKIKVLTIGDVCIRKGVHYVYEVAKKLSDKFEFNWIGKSNLNSTGFEEASKYINFLGEMPNNKIQKYLKQSDIYFLPSLCEGSSISLYEAYISRLYLIYSHNCGFELKNYKRKKFLFDQKKIYDEKIDYFSIKKYEKNLDKLFKKIK
jgi:glycosyltransferase involved in cell wall biosynthesis